MIDAIILAGGFGTRLAKHVPGVPKSLAPVSDRPFLDFQIEWLAAQDIKKVTVAVHHMAEQLIAYTKDRARCGADISAVCEDHPLGTGGAVKNVMLETGTQSTTLVINGDTAFGFSIAPFLTAHRSSRADASVVVAEAPNVARFGTVTLKGRRIIGFKQAKGAVQPGLVNAGAYLLEPAIITSRPARVFSMEMDFLPALAKTGRLHGYVLHEKNAFHDIGTPKSYEAFCSGNKP